MSINLPTKENEPRESKFFIYNFIEGPDNTLCKSKWIEYPGELGVRNI